jgi:HAD superfamily phosphatase
MPPPTKLKALLFGLDGVLVDVSRSYRRAIEETVEHLTGNVVLPGTIQRYRRLGAFSDDGKLAHAIVTSSGLSVPPSRVAEEFQRRYRGEHWDGFIREEVPLVKTGTLDRLAAGGRILGIVTGRPEAEVRWTLDHFGWKRCFPLVVPREKHDGRPAADPYALQHALLILEAVGRRVTAEAAAFVGDTGDAMAAARAAGLRAVGFVPPFAEDRSALEAVLRARGAHSVVYSLDDLPALVDSWADPAVAEALAGPLPRETEA